MSEEEQKHLMQSYYDLHEKYYKLQQKNKQLKEQLENDIDRYEDTISYQLGFDKGKEYLQQIIDKAIECIKNRNTTKSKKERFMSGETTLEKVLKILGGNNDRI